MGALLFLPVCHIPSAVWKSGASQRSVHSLMENETGSGEQLAKHQPISCDLLISTGAVRGREDGACTCAS